MKSKREVGKWVLSGEETKEIPSIARNLLAVSDCDSDFHFHFHFPPINLIIIFFSFFFLSVDSNKPFKTLLNRFCHSKKNIKGLC